MSDRDKLMTRIPLRDFAGLDPVGAIKLVMQREGLTRRDLEPMIGTRARVTEVINRNRGLSIDMIRKLNAGLRIPAEVLIRKSENDRIN